MSCFTVVVTAERRLIINSGRRLHPRLWFRIGFYQVIPIKRVTLSLDYRHVVEIICNVRFLVIGHVDRDIVHNRDSVTFIVIQIGVESVPRVRRAREVNDRNVITRLIRRVSGLTIDLARGTIRFRVCEARLARYS